MALGVPVRGSIGVVTMARQRIGIDVEIMRELTEYTAEIGREINKAGEKLARAALAELEEKSPKRDKYPKGKKPTYSKGWRIKRFGEYGRFRIVVHNEPRYMLTSILEHGFTHQPDKTFIEGREHIKPIQEKLNREFEKAVEQIIKNT